MTECRYNESEQDIRKMKGLKVCSFTNMKDKKNPLSPDKYTGLNSMNTSPLSSTAISAVPQSYC